MVPWSSLPSFQEPWALLVCASGCKEAPHPLTQPPQRPGGSAHGCPHPAGPGILLAPHPHA